MNDWECGWMNKNLAWARIITSYWKTSLMIWKENKCHGMSEINIWVMMSFKMNLCGHLSWAALHVVANIYHTIRTELHVAVPSEGIKMWSQKETAVQNEKEIRKKQGQKRMHWWGVADHQSAICHWCGWEYFLGGAWKCCQQKNCNTCIKQGSGVEVFRLTPHQIS